MHLYSVKRNQKFVQGLSLITQFHEAQYESKLYKQKTIKIQAGLFMVKFLIYFFVSALNHVYSIDDILNWFSL